jgi:predicted DNA-binding transcriptional regulator YafY
MPSEYTDNFNKLQEAIIENKSVEIKYKNYQDQNSERVIKPIKFEMIERKANFYDRLCIKAFCNLRKEDRVFAIYRIQKLKIID